MSAAAVTMSALLLSVAIKGLLYLSQVALESSYRKPRSSSMS